jgi:opacity protein-like surface antigen
MKNMFLKTLTVTGLLTSCVFANTANTSPSKANFGGFYMGLHTGGSMNVVKIGDAKNPMNKTDFSKISPVFGMNVGYLAQVSPSFLLGAEALMEYGKSDITLVDADVEKSATGSRYFVPGRPAGIGVARPPYVANEGNCSVKQKTKMQVRQTYKAQLALVAGYQVADNALLYAKLGMQYNPGIQFSHKANSVAPIIPNANVARGHRGLAAQDRCGKTSMWNPFIGVGAKMACSSNIAITTEYTYALPKEVKFKKDNQEIGKVKINNHTFRLGLQYRF